MTSLPHVLFLIGGLDKLCLACQGRRPALHSHQPFT
jgi:hypothetical protein